jgi:hypothetical protein
LEECKCSHFYSFLGFHFFETFINHLYHLHARVRERSKLPHSLPVGGGWIRIIFSRWEWIWIPRLK